MFETVEAVFRTRWASASCERLDARSWHDPRAAGNRQFFTRPRAKPGADMHRFCAATSQSTAPI